MKRAPIAYQSDLARKEAERDASVSRAPLEAAAMSLDTLRKIGLKG